MTDIHTDSVTYFPVPLSTGEIYDHRAVWSEALTSGLYTQGKYMLSTIKPEETIQRHCCLGVACKINVGLFGITEENDFHPVKGNFTDYRVNNELGESLSYHETLPPVLKEYYGLSDASCHILMEMNDGGSADFRQIATVLMLLPIWRPGYDEQTGLPQ